MESQKIIHVVLIDYFKAARVVESIKTIRSQAYNQSNIHITVIDNSCNSSNFMTLQELLEFEVNLIEAKSNIGYIAAANMAVKSEIVPSDIVLLLNPDIIINDPNTLVGVIKNFDDPLCYIVGPAQVNDDGTKPSIARGYPTLSALISKRTILGKTRWGERKVSEYMLSHFDPRKKQTVPWLQSSCVFIRKSYWEQVDGLNSKYFLFMADIEVCKKAYDHGGYVLYDPTHIAIADGKRCSEGGITALFKSSALRKHVADAFKYYTS